MKNKATKTFIIFLIFLLTLFVTASICNIKTGKMDEYESNENTPETVTKTTTAPICDSVEILVNFENKIPDDWNPDLVDLPNGHKVDKRAFDNLQKMLEDARALGFNPLICSSYRTNEKQTDLFNNKVNEYKKAGFSDNEAIAEAARWVAYPGTSEHQTGLALDIVTVENQILDESQLESKCQQWLMEHCWDYGFILRYPEDKTEITNIDFEPWHYRYVGKKAATIIREKGLCLEEYATLYD